MTKIFKAKCKYCQKLFEALHLKQLKQFKEVHEMTCPVRLKKLGKQIEKHIQEVK